MVLGIYQSKYGSRYTRRKYYKTPSKFLTKKFRVSGIRSRYLAHLKSPYTFNTHTFIKLDVTDQISDIRTFSPGMLGYIMFDTALNRLVVNIVSIGIFDITYLLHFKIHNYKLWEIFRTYTKNSKCYIELFDCWNDGYERHIRLLP